jgi:hypothetical protein
METFNEIKTLVENLEKEAFSFFHKGNSSAGTRVRTGMQDLKKLAQALRTEIQDVKNAKKAEKKK